MCFMSPICVCDYWLMSTSWVIDFNCCLLLLLILNLMGLLTVFIVCWSCSSSRLELFFFIIIFFSPLLHYYYFFLSSFAILGSSVYVHTNIIGYKFKTSSQSHSIAFTSYQGDVATKAIKILQNSTMPPMKGFPLTFRWE